MTRLLPLAALALGLTASASAQPAKGSPFRALGYTPDQLEATEPASPNPFTALLHPDVRPDVDYWTAKTIVESRARGQRRALRGLRSLPTARVRERERGRFNANDDPASAQPLAGLEAEAEPLVEITGTLEPVPPTVADPVLTDRDEGEREDGSFSPWWLVLDESDGEYAVVQVGAEIGDGTHGATSGDVDVFEFQLGEADTYVRLAVETPTSDLDPVMALYGPEGYRILFNDDGPSGTDSHAGIFLSQPGTYQLYVWGWNADAESPGLRDREDPASGYGVGSTGAYTLRIEAIRPDADHYAVHLDAGDVLSAATASASVSDLAILDPSGETRMLSRVDYSSYYADDGPLVSPSELAGDGRGITAAFVAPAAGVYTVAARGEGDYTLTVQVVPSGPQRTPLDGPEQLFVDFDGGRYSPADDLGEGRDSTVLSPLANFLPRWGLRPEDEDAVIDAILQTLRRHLRDGLRDGVPGMAAFDLEILNSRDHADPGRGSGVARVVVGGTEQEVGIEGIFGQASSIDIGNFGRDDIAYVLLGAYSDAATSPNSLNQFRVSPSRTKVELVGVGVGYTAAHEAGHFFGLHHTHSHNDVRNIMDEGGGPLWRSYDIGRDGVFGPGDGDSIRFREDVFQAYYPFAGVQQTPGALALSLAPPPPDDRITLPEEIAAALGRFGPEVRSRLGDVGAARWLYGGPDNLEARPDAWNATFDSGSRVSYTASGLEVEATPGQRVSAWPPGGLWASDGFVVRASVAPASASGTCASAGFFYHRTDGRDEYVSVQLRGHPRWAHLGRTGWVALDSLAPPSGQEIDLALYVVGGRATLFLDGQPVPASEGETSFEARHEGGGRVGPTVSGCSGEGGAFRFRDLEVLALNESAPAVTRLGSGGGLRSLGMSAPAEATEVASVSPAPRQVLKGRGGAGAISVAPVEVGPAGYVYTFGQGRGAWRVRLAESGDVWVQPPGSETWRRDEPGEVSSLLGTAEAATVVTETALSEAEAAAALDALRRASEE